MLETKVGETIKVFGSEEEAKACMEYLKGRQDILEIEGRSLKAKLTIRVSYFETLVELADAFSAGWEAGAEYEFKHDLDTTCSSF
jgi:hypothetical protein